MKIFMLLSIFFSSMFLVSSHPISMMMIIIVQSLNLCVITWMTLNQSWFSYILFLIFLGGIMVLFIYISSLASNEKFFFEMKKIFMKGTLTMISILLLSSLSNKELISTFKNNSITTVFNLYSNLIMSLTIFAMIYLFITLIVVVKMTSFSKGPLRSKH